MIGFSSLLRALSLKLRIIIIGGCIAVILAGYASGTTRSSTAAGTRPSPP